MQSTSVRFLATVGIVAGGLAGANAALLAGAPAAGAVTSPSCTSGTCTITFPETGSTATWDVPSGVTSLSVTLYGADGGTGSGGPAGGSGAEVNGSLAVGPGTALPAGTALTVNVGGTAGVDGAGYNGGGEGVSDSGGGGGATGLSQAATSLLVAGGGGGSGASGFNELASRSTVNGGAGGNAGGPGGAGEDLTPFNALLTGGGGGQAGSGTTGGPGGAAGTGWDISGCPNGSTLTGGSGGNPGSAGTGGGGATAAGAGGGGGYYGGGQGGGSASDECADVSGGGGGGGGSSYTGGPGVSGASLNDTPTFQATSLSGNGEAVVSYADPVATGSPSYDVASGQTLVMGAVSGLLSAGAGTSGPAGETLAVSLPSVTTAHGGTVALDANGDGGFTYTPPAGFTGTDTFSYTVSGTADGSGDYATGTATVAVLAPLQVSTTDVPSGQYGSGYSESLAATGGTGPYSWSVSTGPLPPGLSLSPAGALAGTPTMAGTFNFAVEVTDSSAPTALSTIQDLSLTVGRAPLNIAASSASMTDGEAVPAITPTYRGFVNGDTAASLTTAPTCSTTATSSSPPGSYASTCAGAVDDNYDIGYSRGTVTVTTAPASSPSQPPPVTTTTTAGTSSVAFPGAQVSYPNGAIVSFGAGDYVMAGGRAFAATAAELVAVKKVDHAKVVAAPAGVAAPTGVTLRSGTLVSTEAVDGTTTVYVAGTDGQLHGFSSSDQLSRDGYDAALVVTVPSLDGASVGATAGIEGSAVNALATRADGAIVESAGNIYVFAGGRAFNITSSTAKAFLRTGDPATALTGAVNEADTSAALASGVLITAPGKVYVTYHGEFFLFKTSDQLTAAGYAGTAAVPVPLTSGPSVVSHYSETWSDVGQST